METHTRQALDEFFRQYELKAYKMTITLIRDKQDALEIVQESMLKMVQNYAGKEPAEWPPLFFRILQNKIRDWYRRQKIRNLFEQLLPGLAPSQHQQTEQVQVEISAEQQLLQDDGLERIQMALHSLPLRQQQTFLMRAWQEFSTRETASALCISENSVKTHYARATRQLRALLGDDYE